MGGLNAAKVRKDLSYLGSYGTRGVGYDVEWLKHQIKRELGLTQDAPVAIVGVGNLGRALASYKGFMEQGFRVAGLFDVEGSVVASEVGGLNVQHLDEIKDFVAEHELVIGVIATPPGAAQEVADKLVDAGVRSILNFAPAVVNVPPDVTIRKVDLSMELQILSFYQQRAQAAATTRPPVRRSRA